MCNTNILFCLTLIVSGVWANSEDGADLNLKSIFRTPKDFSKVNFDHFELLERNNFDDKKDSIQTVTRNGEKDEETKAEDKPSKSVANAQVMLRIGGEDIHDCNRVILHRPSYAADHPVYSESLPLPPNDIHYPYLAQHAGYPSLPSASFNIPGCYYGPSHLPSYSTSSYQDIHSHVAPHEFTIHSPETHTTPERPREEVICAESTKPHVIIEKATPCVDKVEEVEVANVQQEPCNASEQKVFVTHSEPAQPTVVEVSSCGGENIAEVSTPECINVNTIHATTLEPEPSPIKVAHAEVNLADIGKACHDSPKDNIDTLLDQALVPFSCQRGSRTNPLLVSYPVVTHEGTVSTIPEEEVVSQSPSCSHDVFCESCTRERNPETPYGHRFSKDVDSLFEIADSNAELYEAPSDNFVKIQPASPPRKLKTFSTVVPTEAECQPEWLVQKTVHSPEKEEVQIVSSCPETVESPCVKEEVVEESTPLSQAVTTVASTKQVPVELPQVVEQQTNHQVDCQNQRTSQQAVTESIPQCPKTIESPYATQKVIQVSNLCHEPFGVQYAFNAAPEVSNYQSVYTEHYPQEDIVQTLNPYSNSPYVQQTIELSNSCHESPYTTQQDFQVGNPHEETAQAVFHSVSAPITFTKPGSLTEITFYPEDDSSSASKVVQVGNSYNGFPGTTSKVDHTITIQPVYKKLPALSSEVPTYQNLLTNVYPQREIVQTSNQYAESPYIQELVQGGNSYSQALYGEEVVQPTYSQFSSAHVGNSYNHIPYVTQEVAKAPTVQVGDSYNEIIQSSNSYPGTVTIQPVYNKVPSVQVSDSYHQAPYATQEIVQKRYPCHNTHHVQTVSKKFPHINVRNSYDRSSSDTQVIQTRNACPEIITVHNKVPTIQVRTSYNQAPCTTQQVFHGSYPHPETYITSGAYNNVPAVQVGNSYSQTSYGSQPACQSSTSRSETAISTSNAYNQAYGAQASYPCSQSISIQSIYNKVPAVAQYQTEYAKPYAYSSYTVSPYTVQHGVQVSGAYPQATAPVYTTPDVKLEKPQVYFSGTNAHSNSHYSVDYAKSGNEQQAKHYLDGYKATCGSSYYSDPLRSILYKHPAVADSFKLANPAPSAWQASYVESQKPAAHTCQYSSPSIQQTQSVHPFLSLYGNYKAPYPVSPVYQHPALTNCAAQQAKVSQPHIYKIVGRYDSVPKGDVSTLNIPDLVPTNQYLKIDRPACPTQHVSVDNVPIVRNDPYAYAHGWPHWKNVPVQREVPLAPNYFPVCGSCAKYRGELN